MQKRYINYRDPVSSFDANAKYSGIIAAGVYTGFDRVVDITGLTFKLDHSLTGQIFTDINQNLTARLGIWVTNQGVVVKEDSAISFGVLTNAGNSKKRIDLIVGRHYHDVLEQGGVNATYEVIKGPTESTVAPSIPEPETCTVLGTVTIQENSNVITSMIWERARPKSLGGNIPALLNEVNRFDKQVQLAQGLTELTITQVNSYETSGRGVLTGMTDGNLFRVSGVATLDLIENKPNGTEIKIFFRNDTVIRGLLSQISGNGIRAGYTQGVRPIVINEGMTSLNIKKGQTVTLIKYDSALAYAANISFGDYWKVLSVDDVPARLLSLETTLTEAQKTLTLYHEGFISLQNIVNQIHPPKSLTWVDLPNSDYEEFFDESGKGREGKPYWGWAEANGDNGTTDFGNRVLMGRQQTAGSRFGTLQGMGGANEFFLSKDQLPAEPLDIKFVWNAQRGNNDSNNIGTISSISPEGPQTAYNKTGKTSNMGAGKTIPILPPYRVTLLLMWIGIPYSFPIS
jgi:hypothetical protein